MGLLSRAARSALPFDLIQRSERSMGKTLRFNFGEGQSGVIEGKLLSDGFYIRNVELDEALRGQGLGGQMYETLLDWANKKGVPVFSDNYVSPEAHRAWSSLRRRGHSIRDMARDAQKDEFGGYYSEQGEPIFRGALRYGQEQ
jgi:GNAT superfamily N-acetyltransferase